MTTVRIWFEKRGMAAYISLLDLQRVMHRALKRSGLPVWYTKGFNPHIYLAFSCPLALGQESLCESCEVKTEEETPDYKAWEDALRPALPEGLRLVRIGPAVMKMGKIEAADYQITVPASMAAALDTYNAADTAQVEKKTKSGKKMLELKEYISQVEYHAEGDNLVFALHLPAGDSLNVSPALLLTWLEQNHGAPAWQAHVLRTALFAADHQAFA